jgi:peroxiredoxin Q/BCP
MHVGDHAPDFELPDHAGGVSRLRNLLGHGPVVVFFYPKADSPGCTKEACAFRDARQELVDAGATVVGVSSDSVEELRRFAERRRLPFPLLSDAAGAVRRLWGVPRDFLIVPGRVTYVLDAGGVVRRVIRSGVRMEKHVREALEEVRRLGVGKEGEGTRA